MSAVIINQSPKPKQKKPLTLFPYILLLPCAIIFSLFIFYPFIKTTYLSFTLTNARGRPVKFVGLSNYLRIFASSSFRNSIAVSFKFAFLVGTFSFLSGFILALAANNQLPGNITYETMYALPLAIASAPASVIWFVIFTPHTGVLNYILGTDIGWLIHPKYALYSVAAITVWSNMGINYIFLLSGLRNVPTELVESSYIDGAGYFRRLFNVIIPISTPQIFFVIFFNIVISFTSFAQIRLLTEGGPYYSTDTIIYSIYRLAFMNNRFETACTQSVVLFAIIFIITRVQFLFEKRWVHY